MHLDAPNALNLREIRKHNADDFACIRSNIFGVLSDAQICGLGGAWGVCDSVDFI